MPEDIIDIYIATLPPKTNLYSLAMVMKFFN